jgi:hypothetical protein
MKYGPQWWKNTETGQNWPGWEIILLEIAQNWAKPCGKCEIWPAMMEKHRSRSKLTRLRNNFAGNGLKLGKTVRKAWNMARNDEKKHSLAFYPPNPPMKV